MLVNPQLLLRSGFLFVALMAMVFVLENTFEHIAKKAKKSALFYSILFALVPFIIAKLPILGTKDLMTTGMSPIVSSAIIGFLTFVLKIYIDGTDSDLIFSDGANFGNTNAKAVNLVFAVVFIEFVIQLVSAHFVKSAAKSELKATIREALNNYFKANPIKNKK